MPIQLRPMRAADLAAVPAVQAACYPAPMQESAAVVLARLRASPDTVLVACDAGGVCAYLFAYRSVLGRITRLGGAFTPPLDPDTLDLHDLAVAPRAAGHLSDRRRLPITRLVRFLQRPVAKRQTGLTRYSWLVL